MTETFDLIMFGIWLLANIAFVAWLMRPSRDVRKARR